MSIKKAIKYVVILSIIILCVYLWFYYKMAMDYCNSGTTVAILRDLSNEIVQYNKQKGYYPVDFECIKKEYLKKDLWRRDIFYCLFYDNNGKEHYLLISLGDNNKLDYNIFDLISRVTNNKYKPLRVNYYDYRDVIWLDKSLIVGYGTKQ